MMSRKIITANVPEQIYGSGDCRQVHYDYGVTDSEDEKTTIIPAKCL
jgi:hypothetical protein